MKKIAIILLVLVMASSLVACGSSDTAEEETTAPAEEEIEKTEEVTEETSDSIDLIIKNIQDDFDSTIEYLISELETATENVGDTYAEYVENKDYIFDWFDLCESTEKDLFDRTYESSISYYKLLAETANHDDYDELDGAFDAFYDEIIDAALDDFFDEIITNALDDVFERYYGGDGIIDEAFDSADYSEWSDEADEFYTEWSDAYSDLYQGWADMYSALYEDWSVLWSGFIYEDNFDVDAILAEKQNEEEENEEEEDAPAEEEEAEIEEEVPDDSTKTEEEVPEDNKSESAEESALVDGMRPEFKKAMDKYEEFYDQYVELLEAYAANPTDMSLMSQYFDMLDEALEMDDAFEEWDEDEMNSAELAYYLEVSARVLQKLANIDIEY